jgi:hypothetical protein
MPQMKLPPSHRAGASEPPRAANLRTALILLSIALVFFGGIIAAQYSGGTAVGIGVLGFGIIGFLLVAIVRKERK